MPAARGERGHRRCRDAASRKTREFPSPGFGGQSAPAGAATVARHRPRWPRAAQGRRWYRRRFPALPSPAMARKLLKRTAVVIVVALLTLLAVRAWDSQRGPPLEPWHTFVPTELTAEEIDQGRLGELPRGRERDLRRGARRGHATSSPEDERVPVNRYFAGSPVYPGRFSQQRLEPLLRAGARRAPRGRRRAPARADRFALQPAPHRAALPRARLRRDRDPPARPRHGAGRPHRRRVGGLVGGDRGSRCARRAAASAPASRCTSSASPTAARWR